LAFNSVDFGAFDIYQGWLQDVVERLCIRGGGGGYRPTKISDWYCTYMYPAGDPRCKWGLKPAISFRGLALAMTPLSSVEQQIV